MYGYEIRKNLFPRTGPVLVAAVLLWLAWGGLCPNAALAYSGGDGSSGDPYQINTVANLEQVGTDAANGETDGKYYKLMNNLDLGGVASWTPIGAEASHPFRGNFDGNSHVIRNLSIGGTGGANIGLFGYTSPTAEIKNLGLENVDIDLDNGQYVGGLAGQNKGNISGCFVTGKVRTGNGIVIGGLVGLNYGGRISHSHSTTDVAGTAIVGGLAGGNTLGNISDCCATGNVSATNYPTGETGAGGLVGANSGGTISGCYATGNVSGQGDGVGGLVGGNGNDDSTGSQGNISNCYATGNISNTGTGTGGLVGGNDTGSTISNCYATGTVSSTGQGSGALVGGNSGIIGSSSALTGGPSLVGYSDGTVTGSSLKSSANLRKQATFSGWNFNTVWGIMEDRGYPYLAGVTEAPAVIGTSPADGAAGVSSDQFISITFSEKIQAGTGINGVTFNGIAIGYDYSISGNVLTINLASSLEDGDYTVTVPAAAVESLQAVPLAADYSFSFTTSPPVQYTLTVIKVGNGTVTPDIGDHLYDEGTAVHLAAEPAPGWTFSGWSGDVDAGGSTVAMDGNKNVTATFVENAVTHTITASAGTGGSISPEGEVLVNDGASRAFNIQAGSGYIIVDVLVDGISQGRISSYTFSNVTADHTIEARFESGFEITANTSWSAITAGSCPGGQPALSDTVIIQNNATLTVDVVDGLAGTIQLGGAGASGGAGTLRFLAGKTITVNSLLFGNGDNAGNVDMSAGGTLKISGSITNINYYGTWIHGTGTVDYCGGDQTVQGRNYYNLVTSGSGTKTLTNDMASIYGNLTVGSGTTLYLDNSSANHNTPTSTGTLTLQDNATLLINSGNLFPANYITYSLASGSTVNYNRLGIQNIAARTYGNLTTSGSGTKTLQGNTVVNGNLTIGAGTTLDTRQNYGYSLTVRGDWTNNGSFTAWTSTVTLDGAAIHSLGGSAVTSFNNLTLSDTVNASQNFNAGGSGTGALTVNTGAVLNPAADVVINGSGPRGTLTGSGTIKVTRTTGQQHMYNQYYMSTFSLTGLTVEYAASGNQDVWYPGNSYGNLVLSSGGTKKPLWPLTVYGNLTIGGGVTLNQNGMDITLGGNWTNNGSLTASNNAVTLNGAGVQEMTGSTTFRRLTLNNAAGLTIHSDVTITNTLTLTSGKITTGTNKVILSYASGTISGANSNNYIVGGLQKIIAAGATTRTFEVGTATNYNPVTVAFGNVATAGNLVVKATAGDHPNIGTSTIDPSKNVNVYWTLINSGTVFDSFGAIFNFTAGNIDAGASTGSFIIGKYDGSAWTYPDISARNATSTQATGMTSLSDFVLGEGREGDITAPEVADSTIRTSGLSDTSVTLSWNKATDDVSAQSALQYMVYRSDSNHIDTVVNIEANGTAVGSYAADINTKQITGLTAGTTYYFNVVVKDEAGNKTAYTMKEVTTCASIDGGGLNYESANWAITPSMAVYDEHLYTAWVENTNEHTQIRVKKYDGAAWSPADSGSLNMDSGKNAYNPVLCGFNGSLYLAWYEDPGSNKLYQVYIRKYAGGTSWDEGVKLSYSDYKAFNVKLKVYDNTLCAVWVENNGTRNQIRAKMTSNGSAWETADGNNTLNYNPADHVTIPSAEVYDDALYVAWSEKGKIRLRKYDGSWSGADDGSLNYDDSKTAHVPILLNNGSLYLIWLEQNASDIYQVRAQKYNGTSWAPAGSDSLNDDESQGASMLNGTVYHGTLYAAWTENGKVRIKTYDEDEETWVPSGDGNINYDASKASSGLTFMEYQEKLYISWKESNESSVEQIRVKVYQGGE
ncbi:beta strand repeat-containing protein [Candidatus Formimonas warabiya]|uniref:Fibronectin type-III domain-containing protein n=1 Tax=Formimonas warabiya TaxID=1761012 RepID=A0A3G1L052_FORW1|nr:GLUG motif-containing protein [Candidatus Formimonas warabiya]ATW28166.1 hypothetical protein DCMF_28470 [Candidatus Formimonas warabiya]